jgi:hypothetical protein
MAESVDDQSIDVRMLMFLLLVFQLEKYGSKMSFYENPRGFTDGV